MPFDPELFTIQQIKGLVIIAVSLAIMLAMLADAGKPYRNPPKNS